MKVFVQTLRSVSRLNVTECDFCHLEAGSDPSLQAERWPFQEQLSPTRLFSTQSISQWQAPPTCTQAPPTPKEWLFSSFQTFVSQQTGDSLLDLIRNTSDDCLLYFITLLLFAFIAACCALEWRNEGGDVWCVSLIFCWAIRWSPLQSSQSGASILSCFWSEEHTCQEHNHVQR